MKLIKDIRYYEFASVRVGHFDHLYLALTPALPADALVDTGWSAEPWLRYFATGLPANFNAMSPSDRMDVLSARAFAAVRLLAPDAEKAIANTEALIQRLGADVRIHLLRHTTRSLDVRLSYTIAAPESGHPSRLWVAVTDLSSGRTAEKPVLDLQFFDDVFSIASRVAVNVLRSRRRSLVML